MLASLVSEHYSLNTRHKRSDVMNTLEIITSYDVAVEAEQSAFSDLREVASYWNSKQAFNDALFEGENEYMERFHGDGAPSGPNPDAKKKSGSWKYATYLPKAYQSSKSVLGNALDSGIRINDKAKSQIEKELKSLKNSGEDKVDVSPDYRAKSYVTKLSNCWHDVSLETRVEIIDSLQHLIDVG